MRVGDDEYYLARAVCGRSASEVRTIGSHVSFSTPRVKPCGEEVHQPRRSSQPGCLSAAQPGVDAVLRLSENEECMRKRTRTIGCWLVLFGCHPVPVDATSVRCGQEDRPRLACETEFAYDANKVSGGFTALGVGVEGSTEVAALRQIDAATERYIASAKRLCEEYNACIVDGQTYAIRAENLRRRLARVPELADGVRHAVDHQERLQALSSAYEALVPEEEQTGLDVELAIVARRPGEAQGRAIGKGERLPSGTDVWIGLRPSRDAYVYLFQKSPQGSLSVLFPDSRMSLSNPVKAGEAVKIPPDGGAFRLDDHLGTERVYVVASVGEVASLDEALSPSSRSEEVPLLAAVASAGTACKSRGLSFADATGCVRTRGWERSAEASQVVSYRAKTEAGDTMIVQVFSFEHVEAVP